MHNLKGMSFLNYTSPYYTGPAVRVGAGVQNFEVYQAASQHGLRVVSGSCPTVGMAGGFTQGGGHGPLGATYGLGADNTLEFEVVTVDGQQLAASSTQNADIYWALSGGGSGNYAVIISMTAKAHTDGPLAGAGFSVFGFQHKPRRILVCRGSMDVAPSCSRSDFRALHSLGFQQRGFSPRMRHTAR